MKYDFSLFADEYSRLRSDFPEWRIESLAEDAEIRSGKRLCLWVCTVARKKKNFTGVDCDPGKALSAAMAQIPAKKND